LFNIDAPENAIDSLCYNTLVPKNVMQRYISLILDNKSLLFCGPNGTSKSLIARKIAEFLSKRQKKNVASSIAYYDVENKSTKDLKSYLTTMVDTESELPNVLILDNLQSISNISDAFSDYFQSTKKCSFVIGTINQSDVASLNLHQNFKWILCLNHTEPVKSFLSRFLNRRLIDYECKYQLKNADLELLINWMPQLWSHVNKYIEMYNSIDLTLGPKIFATFPLDMRQAQIWFVELWNNSLVPYLIETIKEGLEVYGSKTAWENPKIWLSKTLPWLLYDENVLNSLYSIEADNFEFFNFNDNLTNDENSKSSSNSSDLDALNPTNLFRLESFNSMNNPNSTTRNSLNRCSNENDKLLNMLMRLQETTLNQNFQLTNNSTANESNGNMNNNFIKLQKSIESII